MTDEEAAKLKKIEDNINKFFEGTSRETDLRVMRFLRIRHPYQQTSLLELDRDITSERKKTDG